MRETSRTPCGLKILVEYHSHAELSFFCSFSDGESPTVYVAHDVFVKFRPSTNVDGGTRSRLPGAAAHLRTGFYDSAFSV